MQPALGDPALAGGVGLDDPQSSLPTPAMLGFCDMFYIWQTSQFTARALQSVHCIADAFDEIAKLVTHCPGTTVISK